MSQIIDENQDEQTANSLNGESTDNAHTNFQVNESKDDDNVNDENDTTSDGNDTNDAISNGKDESGKPIPKLSTNGRTSSKKDGQRKGKWTPEEEKYTNKVIEVFNAGLLKLGDTERGITLRAYLADKLQCDPMRITKKYTGASCLGKRVYHFDYQHADNNEAERLRQELIILENNFKVKLEQMNRKRANEPTGFDESYRISTPAIDALLERSRPMPGNPTVSVDRPNLPPFPAYPPHLFAAPPPGYAPSHPHHFYPMPQPMFSHMRDPSIPHDNSNSADHDSNNGSNSNNAGINPPSSSSSSATIGDKKMPTPHPSMMPQFFRGPNGELFVHQSYASGIPQYYMAMPSPYMPMADENLARMAQHFPLPPSYPPGSHSALSWKDIHAAGQYNAMMPPMPSLGGMSLPPPLSMMHAPPIPVIDVAQLEPKNKKPRRSSSSNKLNVKTESSAAASAAEEELLNRKIELSEEDQNEAATSLLGFINHVKRNSSQEDLAEFYEEVHQKSANGLKSPDMSMPRPMSYGMDLHGLDKSSSFHS